MGNLQPLTLPDTLDPLVVDYPARLAQELGDLAVGGRVRGGIRRELFFPSRISLILSKNLLFCRPPCILDMLHRTRAIRRRARPVRPAQSERLKEGLPPTGPTVSEQDRGA